MDLITDRYAEKISGIFECYDRVIIRGTPPGLCHADGLTGYLYAHNIRIFDYPRFAEPFRDESRENAEKLAAENQLEIEFVRSRDTSKEKLIEGILKKHGRNPGLVHILSAMEACPTYKPWHDRESGKNYLPRQQNLWVEKWCLCP